MQRMKSIKFGLKLQTKLNFFLLSLLNFLYFILELHAEILLFIKFVLKVDIVSLKLIIVFL